MIFSSSTQVKPKNWLHRLYERRREESEKELL